MAVLFTLYFDAFLGGCGGWPTLFYAELILLPRGLFTSVTFYFDTFRRIYCERFGALLSGATFVVFGSLVWGFLSNDRYLSFYKDEFIFF